MKFAQLVQFGNTSGQFQYKILVIVSSKASIASQWRIQDFPEEGAYSQSGWANLFFCRKLPENERIWTPGGGGGTSLVPVLWFTNASSVDYLVENQTIDTKVLINV